MIAFELTMSHCGSWNGRWTEDDRNFIRVMDQRKVPKEYWGKDFCYRWGDGWEARVTVTHVDVKEGRRLERLSSGFAGYDWMIRSIIKHGEIVLEGGT